MANRQETIIIDVQVTDVKKQLGETAQKIFELKEENKRLQKQQRDGVVDWETSIVSIKQNEAQIKLLTAANKSLSGQLVVNEVANRKYGDSNVELRAQVVALETAYNGLTEAQKETAEGKALLQQQQDLKAAVKRNAEELGNFQDSVGNYKKGFEDLGKAFSSIPGPIGKMAGGVDTATTAFKGLSLSNPIGWIGPLIALIVSLTDKLKGNKEMAEGLAKATGFLNGIISFFTKLIIDGTKAVVNFVGGIKSFPDLMSKIGNAIKENILNRLESFSVMGKAIVKILKGDIKEGFKELGDGLVQNTTGVKNFSDKATTAFNKLGKSIKDATGGGSELAALEKRFETANRNSQKLQLQYQTQAEKLRQLRDDESKTIAERIKYNDQLGSVLKKQLSDESNIAQMQLKIAKLKIKQDGETKENLDALAEAETRLIDIKERITGQESEQLANLNSLRREAVAKQKENLKAKADNEKKAEEERLKALKDQADKEIAALDQELALEKLRVQEKNAGKKLSNEEYHKQRLAEIDSETVNVIGKLNAQLRAGEITEKQFEDAKTLRRQEVRTQIAEENAAFEAQELENRRVAAATDLQNEMALAEMKNQSLYSLKLQQLETERLAEIEAAEKTGADTLLIEEKYTELKKQLSRAEMAAKLDMASGFAGNIAEIFGKSTKVGKAAASAQIAIDSAKGAFAAFTSMASIPFVGPVLGAAAAGAVVAKGVKSIKDVWAVKSGLPNDDGGGGNKVPEAPTGTATNYTPATKGADLVLNSDQAGSLNGKISAAQPASGGIDYDLLAKSMSKQPAPVMVYSEFKSFEGKVTSFDEQTKI